MTYWFSPEGRAQREESRWTDALQALESDRAPSNVLAALERLGVLTALGHALGTLPLSPEEARDAVSGMDCGGLEDAAIALCQGLDALDADDPSAPSRIVDALLARDRVEHVLVGARGVLAEEAPLDVDQRTLLAAFDELVRPQLHRLTALNEVRSEAARAIPSFAARFWWHTEGAWVAPSAWANAAAVAELVASSSNARRAFDALVATASALGDARQAPVVSIADWLGRRRTKQATLRVAAATEFEKIGVLSRPDLDLTLRPPHRLVLDLRGPLEANRAPELRVGSGAPRPFERVPHTTDRYRVELDAVALEAASLSIVVPFASGTVLVVVPGGEAEPR